MVMTLQEFAPSAVAEFRSTGGRPNDVGEQDGGEHAVRFRLPLPTLDDVIEKRLQLGE